jgi:hypothetical protein
VVVLRPTTMGCRFVGFSSPRAGVDFYSCPSGVRRVVLDTRGNRDRGLGSIWALPQQQKTAEKADLAANSTPSSHLDGRRGGAPWENEATSGSRARKIATCPDRV